jgi:DNA-binding SARP family transcriptional activator/tetratricopeptide (TPR) repeat protein
MGGRRGVLEFRILGPFEVLAGGRPLALGRRRERVLAAVLLLSANRVVSAGRLAEDLWAPGEPPPAAASALRVHVSRLRAAFDGEGEVLATRPGGYLLSVPDGAVDAGCFGRGVDMARERAAAGDHRESAALLRAALGLWRGPALGDLADLPFAVAAVARLEEARLSALEHRVADDLACGEHASLIGELEALTTNHPTRERFWALRMLALYRSERQTDALAVFQGLRRYLGDELGLEPGGAVRRLECAILRHDPALDLAQEPPTQAAEVPTPPAHLGPGTGPSLATVLITDLVRSTEQRSQLGEERADELRRAHDDLLADCVTAHGGRVVKGTGDGLLAAFGSASDALSGAVEMQRALDRHNLGVSAPEALSVRIGLSVGDVSWDGGDCFGTPLVEAARLEAAAEGGQIVCSDFVRVMARGRGGHRFKALGELTLKGLSEPLAACLVEWAPAVEQGGPPLPVLLARAGRVFVGRDTELERLGVLWQEAAAGPERRLALLAGEPGIGKTRLAAELAATLPGRPGDHLVLGGRCDEDLGVPYQPFVEALRHYVAHAGTSPELGRYAGELARLVPELASIPESASPMQADPETERYRLFDAVAAWLSALSAERPVLLVLDDLHWATKPTLLMLRHILRFGEPMRLLVVVTYRDTDVGRGHPVTDWTADLRRETGVERFALSGLDLAGVLAFVEAAGNPAAAERSDGDGELQAIARAVWAETDGNPFFIAELLRHLAEAGKVERRGDLWFATVEVGELGIPEGVREVIGRRLSRLTPSANRVLSVAAVAGAEFESAVVGRAGEVQEDDLYDALEEAVAARLLTESGPRYGFSHALVRATLYDSMGSPRRKALHARVAEAIEGLHAEALDDHLPALVHHWAEADPKRAVDYAARAGHRALAQLAHDEAARFYRQALDLLADPEDTRHLPLGVCLGEAQRRAGDPTHRQTLLAASNLARERGDAGALIRAALATASGAQTASLLLDPDRVAVLEAALPFVPESDLDTRARLLATLSAELHWDPDERRRAALSDEALDLARRAGNPATLAHVLLARPHAIMSAATLAERLAVTTELLGLAEDLDDPVLRAWAHGNRYRTLLELPDFDQADPHLDAFARAAETLGHSAMLWVLGCNRVSRHTLAGRLAEAHDEALATLDLGRESGHTDAALSFGVQRYLVRLHQGLRPEDSAGSVQIVGAYSSRFPATGGWVASAYAELGRLDEARATIAIGARTRFRLPMDQTWIVGMCQYASAVAAVGDARSATVIYDLLHPYRAHNAMSGVATAGVVHHYEGLLAATMGRDAVADDHFAAAVAAHERFTPVWLAWTRLEWGRALFTRAAGDDVRGRELLQQALAAARELGLGTVERRAAALLA